MNGKRHMNSEIINNLKPIVSLPLKGFWGALLLLLFSCSGDDASDFYPDIITEFAMIRTNDLGTMVELTTDDERIYTISNPKSGYDKNVCYRVVCGFVPDGETATLYNATGAYLLKDSTKLAYEPDAVNVTSVWKSGRFINMHLSPLTQGGTQYWGYRIDGVNGNTTHITLHHRQNGDPLSYTKTVYASILIDDLEAVPTGGSIALHIKTFKGEQTWTFQKP